MGILSPTIVIFFPILIMSTIAATSSQSWLMAWASLELNTFMFLPLISMTSLKKAEEPMIKYFLVQASASMVMLIFMMLSLQLESPFTPMMVILMCLMMKLGVAPMHQWFPSVMKNMSWNMCFLILTWQKLAPLCLIYSLPSQSSLNMMLIIMACSSAIVGGLGGLNQTLMRPLIAYSSIGHMGWVVLSSSLSMAAMTLYLTVYIILTFSVVVPIMAFSKKSIYQNNSSGLESPAFKMIFMVSMFSLAGFPPLTGFFPKLFVIQTLNFQHLLTPLVPLIMGAMMNLYFYSSIILSWVPETKKSTLNWMKPKIYSSIILLLSAQMFPLLIIL